MSTSRRSSWSKAGSRTQGDGGTLEVDENAPIVQVVNRIVTQGVRTRASDIHIEPMRDHVRVRYRVDGAMTEAIPLPARMASPLASRIKVHGGAQHRRASPAPGRPVLACTSTVVRSTSGPRPSPRSTARRSCSGSLDKTESLISLERPRHADAEVDCRTSRSSRRRSACCCAPGPTGSGKTTTLYATLTEVNDPTRNVVTIEDPVEYQFDGINQMQVSERRHHLRRRPARHPPPGPRRHPGRRDPRRGDGPDRHAGGADRPLRVVVAARRRLRSPRCTASPTWASSRSSWRRRSAAVVGQRLLRRICYELPGDLRADARPTSRVMESALSAVPDEWTRGAGCNVCAGTGYRGRIGVYELLDDRRRHPRADRGQGDPRRHPPHGRPRGHGADAAAGVRAGGRRRHHGRGRDAQRVRPGHGWRVGAHRVRPGSQADTPERRPPDDLVAPNAFQTDDSARPGGVVMTATESRSTATRPRRSTARTSRARSGRRPRSRPATSWPSRACGSRRSRSGRASRSS